MPFVASRSAVSSRCVGGPIPWFLLRANRVGREPEAVPALVGRFWSPGNLTALVHAC